MADFGSIWGLMKDVTAVVNKGLKYKSTRKNLKASVENLSPMVEKIEQDMKRNGLPTEQVEKLKEKLAENKKALATYKIGGHNFLYAPEYESKLSQGLTATEGVISQDIQLVMLQYLVDIISILTARGGSSLASTQISALNTCIAGTQTFKDFSYKFTVGLNGDSMKKLKFKLLRGDEKVINLYGLPGSGKTTLATKLCLDDLVKGKFKSNIIFETLGSKAKSDEAMKMLKDQLSKCGEDPVLLVLDDVWPRSEDIVEIKTNLTSPHSRILVTSRAQIRTVKTRFLMDKLSDEDAEKLLRYLVQASDVDFDEPENREILLEIVKGCEGLPLALEFVGEKLNGMDIEVFQKVQSEWSRRGPILDPDTKLLERLQDILNLLVDEDTKDCFMDLGLFPEDHKIPVIALIDMWIELNQRTTIDAMISVKKLVAMNLAARVIVRRLVGTQVDNYYNNHFLIQHNFCRELAIRMSQQKPLENRRRLIIDLYGNQNDAPQWWPEQQQSLAAAILSISTDQKVTPSWCNIQAPHAVVLVLNLNTVEYTLPEFIKEMGNLKVLLVTNYGYNKTDLRNLELLGSLLSLKRIRLEKVSIPSLCDLKNVHKLSLYMCDVKEAFEDSSVDFSRAMPKLEDLSIEYCKDLVKLLNGFCLMATMKNLTISSCHKFIGLPEEIGKLENLETLRITYCAAFEEMSDSIINLKNLSLLDISFCVSLKKLPDNIVELQNLKRLYMTGCWMRELPDSVIDLNKLESVICDEYAFPLWEVMKSCFPRLKLKKVDGMHVNLDWLL
ncbi:hypothetical protein QN277_024103 [Acacia crassicarpa]|uniref:NB-ARC domain-containing protein n=1 Tax=Acacia crassicarpa TaxID=499986 RepID=A0AAE1K913_9FABA|nr:hypothetical protein QN277_024103 [Acacia crassicarpa]